MGLDLLELECEEEEYSGSVQGRGSSGEEGGEEEIQGLRKHLSTIRAIQDSCKAAVGLCDDLLQYDEMEGSSMALQIQTMPAHNLFIEAIRPFFIQVRCHYFLNVIIVAFLNLYSLYIHIVVEQCILQAIQAGIRLRCELFSAAMLSSLGGSLGTRGQQAVEGATTIRNVLPTEEKQWLRTVFLDVDKRRIIQVVGNLLSSALRQTPKGSIVTVSARLSHFLGPPVTSHGDDARGSVMGSIFPRSAVSNRNRDRGSNPNSLHRFGDFGDFEQLGAARAGQTLEGDVENNLEGSVPGNILNGDPARIIRTSNHGSAQGNRKFNFFRYLTKRLFAIASPDKGPGGNNKRRGSAISRPSHRSEQSSAAASSNTVFLIIEIKDSGPGVKKVCSMLYRLM